VDWIHLAQYWAQWRVIVNMVMKLQVRKGREFLKQLSDYQLLKKGFVPRIELVIRLLGVANNNSERNESKSV
jgi:hypothetical protein